MAIIFAVYNNFIAVQHTFDLLHHEGYPETHISVIMLKNATLPFEELSHDQSAQTVADLLSVSLSPETVVLVTPQTDGIIAMGAAVSTTISSHNEIADTLAYLGLPSEQRNHYENQIKKGLILLAINDIEEYLLPKIINILHEQGAEQIQIFTASVSPLPH